MPDWTEPRAGLSPWHEPRLVRLHNAAEASNQAAGRFLDGGNYPDPTQYSPG